MAESIAKGKRLTKKTQELVAKAHGKPLGREMLEWTSIRLMQLAQYYWPLTADGAPKFRAVEAKDRSGQPFLDKDGKPTFNQVPVGDVEKFMEIAGALSLTSFRLARFQSPTLQAIAVGLSTEPHSMPARPRRGGIDDTPTAKLVRQVLGAISEFDKAMTVAKLRRSQRALDVQPHHHLGPDPETAQVMRQPARARIELAVLSRSSSNTTASLRNELLVVFA